MKTASFLLVLSGALAFSACTSSRYAASGSEYDDVYYSRNDAPVVLASEAATAPEQPTYQAPDQDNYVYNADRYRRPVDSYYDEYYDEDDFYFSRRVRRFDSRGAAAWRYYDPFFTNDLYFVMGTPYWNSWNANGWYNWNYPRFGATLGWNSFNPYGGFAFNDPFWANTWAPWNSFNYYNPWVNAYYGYDPFFAPGWGNPYAAGFNNGFYNGFNSGFNSAYFCPPYGAAGFAAAPRLARNNNNVASYRRPTANSGAAQTTYNPASSRPNTTRTSASAAGTSARPTAQSATTSSRPSSSQYLQPRSNVERTTRPTSTPSTYTRPAGAPATQQTGTRPSATPAGSETAQPRVYTRPSYPSTTTSPARPSASPATGTERNTAPSTTPATRRTYTESAPRTSSPSYNSTPSSPRSSSPSYESSPRSSSPSYNSSPSRSSSPSYNSSPSRSSSPSSGGSSGSRPSSSSGSRRP